MKVESANNSKYKIYLIGSVFGDISVSDISFGSSEDEILVTFHNYNTNNVWYTNDGGDSWENKEGDLPDIPVKAVLMNPFHKNEVFLGTGLGVWRTENF